MWGVDELRENAVRHALFQHLDGLVAASDDGLLDWRKTEDFLFDGERFVVRQTRGAGICKPASLSGALSITTVFTPYGRKPPYEDFDGADGYPRYKYQGTDPNLYTNRALRVCLEYELPLVYFLGVQPGVYQAIYPVFVIADNPNSLDVTLGFQRSEVGFDVTHLTEAEKRYALVQTRRRLHQPVFRERVLHAYATRCAVCSLRHRTLLDAAHVIGDAHSDGDPIVPNGISLCKIHHAAFDQNLMGIRPDYRVVVNSALLEERDGPMLAYGIQAMHETPLQLPAKKIDRPDPDRLAVRYGEFLSAS
ncbi:MAG: HNH endonuclease [Acidimicrobiaceae bacterium]|nr:HNH endonuclease [Acidimicrobiaceae bacterium]